MEPILLERMIQTVFRAIQCLLFFQIYFNQQGIIEIWKQQVNPSKKERMKLLKEMCIITKIISLKSSLPRRVFLLTHSEPWKTMVRRFKYFTNIDNQVG